MKLLLNIFCWLLAVFCVYFPFAYSDSDMNKKDFKISHILVDSEQKAIDIKNDIQNNKNSFEKIASDEKINQAKEKNGELDFISKDMLIDSFKNVVENMEVGTVSEPLKTDAGWHIIRLEGVKHFSDSENFARRYS